MRAGASTQEEESITLCPSVSWQGSGICTAKTLQTSPAASIQWGEESGWQPSIRRQNRIGHNPVPAERTSCNKDFLAGQDQCHTTRHFCFWEDDYRAIGDTKGIGEAALLESCMGRGRVRLCPGQGGGGGRWCHGNKVWLNACRAVLQTRSAPSSCF